MKRVPVYFFIIPALAIAGLTLCKKEDISKTPPLAAYKLIPANGLSTTVFQFDATESKATSSGDTILFIRWDWNNDSIWDTGFSRSRLFTHRYYIPGTYSPRMEIRNEAGLSDTVWQTVQVGRGYSAPQPSFTVSPSSGNLRTEFIFDAGKTRDDEDSLNTLKFRWDWEGDGNFDTGKSDQTVISHFFNASNIYRVVLEVTDPTNTAEHPNGLVATTHRSISVSTSNPRLVPLFTMSPEKPNSSDTVQFDASASYDPDNAGNTFTYRWNFTKDDDFDTEYLDSPIATHQFIQEGENEVVMEIRDQWGLINQLKKKIFIAHSNLKPTASYFIGYEFGNLTTGFYFDASGSTDGEDFPDLLKVRWDFESDGTWDTQYAKEKTMTHKFSSAGIYRIKMQVVDSGGLTDTTSLSVTVTGGTNPTGLIMDKNKNMYYGTVQIGSQWWMSENLNESGQGRSCYSDQSANCSLYGGLYTWTSAMNNVTTEKTQGICPQGWHIPARTEWQQLMDYYGLSLAKQHLEVTGDSDFRLFFAGQKSTTRPFYKDMGLVANFWTSTKSISGDNAYEVNFQKAQDNPNVIPLAKTYGFSVRCIKD